MKPQITGAILLLIAAGSVNDTFAAEQRFNELEISMFKSGLGTRDISQARGIDIKCTRYNWNAYPALKYGHCHSEYFVTCGHIVDKTKSRRPAQQIPEYRKCVNALWPLVRAENWSAVYNLTEKGVKNPIYVEASARPVPPSGGASLDHGSYADIDDLSTDDIGILDVAPAPEKPQKQKYCGCMFDHPEIFGFCRDDSRLRATKAIFGSAMYDEEGYIKEGFGSGMYDFGYYPWTAQCTITNYR